MAAEPAFAAVPRSLDIAVISAANTGRDGTGTIVTVCAGGTAGSRVSAVHIKATVSTTVGMVRLFLSTDTGTTWRLRKEIPLTTAITVSASVAGFEATVTFDGLVLLGATDLLGASTHNAETFVVHPDIMDL